MTGAPERGSTSLDAAHAEPTRSTFQQKQFSEKHPVQPAERPQKRIILGIPDFLRDVRGAMRVSQENRRLDAMGPGARERVLREAEEAPLNSRVDVMMFDGENREVLDPKAQKRIREALDPQVQERIRQAQRELIVGQNVDISNLKPAEQRAKLEELRKSSRVVVLNNGHDIMLVQGDQRGYTVDSEGKLQLQTYTDKTTDAMTPRSVERSGEVNVAKVTFESATATTSYGTSTEIPRVRVMHADTTGNVVSDKRDIERIKGNNGVVTEENVFSGLERQLIHIYYGRMPGMRGVVTGRDIFVLNVGKQNPPENVNARALRTAADVMESKIDVPQGQEIVIAGAGADMLKVKGKRGGILEVANITEPWQVEGVRPPVAPEAPTERQTIDLALSADDARRFSQLPRELQINLLIKQDFLPKDVNASSLDFKIVDRGNREIPEDVIKLDGKSSGLLESMAATVLHRAQNILRLKSISSAAREIHYPSEMALLIGKIAGKYEDPAESMILANSFIEDLRRNVDSIASEQNNSLSRQQIARDLINTSFPKTEGIAQEDVVRDALVDRLAQSVGGRTNGEIVGDVIAAKRPEGTTPEDFKEILADQLGEVEGLKGLSPEVRERIIDALRGEVEGYTEAELTSEIVQGLVRGDLRDQRETIQKHIDVAKGKDVDISRVQQLLDTNAPKPIEASDIWKAIGEALAKEGIETHKTEIAGLIDRMPNGNEKDKLRARLNELAPEKLTPETLNDRAVSEFIEYRKAHPDNTSDARLKMAVEIGRIISSLPENQREGASILLTSLIPAEQVNPSDIRVLTSSGQLVPLGTAQTNGAATSPTAPGE